MRFKYMVLCNIIDLEVNFLSGLVKDIVRFSDFLLGVACRHEGVGTLVSSRDEWKFGMMSYLVSYR